MSMGSVTGMASLDQAAASFTSTRGPGHDLADRPWRRSCVTKPTWMALCSVWFSKDRALILCAPSLFKLLLLLMHRYTRILTHIHIYEQIFTAIKTQDCLYALPGLFTWGYAEIFCPKTARMGENISHFNRCTSIHIWSYNRQKYFWNIHMSISWISDHIVNIPWISGLNPVNIKQISP